MWYIFELLAMIVIGVFITTQIIAPAIGGYKSFPLFRRRKLTAEEVDIREALEQLELQEQAEALRQKLDSKRKESNEKGE